MLWDGTSVALGHVGDSRGYLLRDGSLFQITHDHTLAEKLKDEAEAGGGVADPVNSCGPRTPRGGHPTPGRILELLDGRIPDSHDPWLPPELRP